jgi:type I restriction enzyme R subunit
MDAVPLLPIQLFDPDDEASIVARRLPHWSQAGTISFITWRTCDSLPKAVLDRWFEDRRRWLAAHGIDASSSGVEVQLNRLDRQLVSQFRTLFWNRWHDALDECFGECPLRRQEIAQIVSNSLHHFDMQRYRLLDFVVMPNHVHLLAAFPDDEMMLKQCESWKHFAASEINRCLKRKGRFWQPDGFDHLVRSEAQFEYLRRYIAANPARARLPAGNYIAFSKPL